MRLILGEERHEQAYVANEILTFLIKALFDREYGQDAFSFTDLIQAVFQMSRDQTLPELCEANAHIERSLVQKCQVDERQFQQTMGAAANRLDKFVEHEHLYQMFTHVPEWDTAAEEYVGNAFDFREFLSEDAVILFDIGELRTESQHALTMVLLSNLWDAVQGRRGRGRSLTGDTTHPSDTEDTIVNMIIEEAAAVATSSLVYEQFIPQGRAFGVSLGLILQYPEQVALHSTSDRPYTEILNNVKTKFIGNIATDAKLAESMAHENLSTTELRNRVGRLPDGEWIAQLPSPGFGKTGPAPFSLASLPIPDGHPESENPLAGDDRHLFEEMSVPRVMQRTQQECSLPGSESGLPRKDARDTLEKVGDDADTETEATNTDTVAASSDASETTFFGTSGESDDTEASATDDAAPTPPNDASSTERDIGGSPAFGSADATPAPEEPAESTGAEQLTLVPPDEHTAAVNTATESSTTRETAESQPSAALPVHIHFDTTAEHYVCECCGAVYAESEERKARACCQFASKDDVYAAARRARDTAESPSELFTRLGNITEHAEEYGIEVTIQDFASLETAADESAATPNGGPEPPETAHSQNTDAADTSRFKEATTDIPDDTLRAEGVTRDEAAFLGLVLDAMNHQLEEYSLLESMTALEEPFSNLDVEVLKEKGFIEEHRSFWQTYYSVLPAGRMFLDRSLDVNPGIGDLGEKTPHKAGVIFLEAWLSQQEDVARTEIYYQYTAETVFDAAGFDTADDLIWVGEVETPSHNDDALLSDYEKLASVDAAAVWACENKEFLLEVIETLTDAGKLDVSLTSTQTRTISSLRAAIGNYDVSGMATLHTFRSLKTEVDTDS